MFRREMVISYPNGDYETSMNMLLESVDNDINSYIRKKEELESLIFMSEATDENMVLFEAEEKSLVGKLGQSIINFFEMIRKKLSELKQKFTSLFKNKEESSDSNLKRAMENHPELAMSFYDGIRNGNIRVADYKDIDSLLNTVEKLAKDMEAGKIDSKTFSEKVDDAMAAVEKKVKPIANILGAVTTITGAITGLCFLRKSFIKQSQDYENAINRHNEKINEIMINMANEADRNVKDYQANAKKSDLAKDPNVKLNKSTELSMLMKKWNQVSSIAFQHESKILDVLEKITNIPIKIGGKEINAKHTDKESIKRLGNKGKFVDYKDVNQHNEKQDKEDSMRKKAEEKEKSERQEQLKKDADTKKTNGGNK